MEVKYYRKRLYRHIQSPSASAKAVSKRSPVTSLFFDYDAVISASFMRDKAEAGWACTIEVAGENYETKKFEVVGLTVRDSFESAAAAIRCGKRIIKALGVDCIDTRAEKL